MIFENLRRKKKSTFYYLSGVKKRENIYIYKYYFKVLVKIQNLYFVIDDPESKHKNSQHTANKIGEKSNIKTI